MRYFLLFYFAAIQLIFAGEYLDINISPSTYSLDAGENAIFEITFTPKNGFNSDIDLSSTLGSLSQTTISPPVESKSINLTVNSDLVDKVQETLITIIGRNGSLILDSAECLVQYIGPISNYEWENYTPPIGNIWAIVVDKNGDVWFGGRGDDYLGDIGGVSKFDGENWTTYTTTDGLCDINVTSIAIDSNSNKWIGTRYGLSKFDGENWTTYSGNNFINDLLVDKDNNLWVVSDNGVKIFNGENWTSYTTSDGLVHNNVVSIAIDKDGFKWFGTDGEGISKFDGTFWTTYSTENSPICGDVIYAIEVDRENRVWFGTENQGVSMFDGNSWMRYTYPSLVNNTVYDIKMDNFGYLWFTIGGSTSWNERGVSIFTGSEWIGIKEKDGLPHRDIYSVAIDSSGNKWFGINLEGVWMLKTPTETNINNIHYFSHNTLSIISISQINKRLIINYNSNLKENADFYIFNMNGKCIYHHLLKSIIGYHEIDINTQFIPNGNYILRVDIDNCHIASKKFFLIR